MPGRALDGEIQARPTFYVEQRDRPAPVVLNAVATVAPAELISLTGGRVMVTGTPHQLNQHVAKWRAEGRLVHADIPQPDGTPGRYALVVQLAPRTIAHRQASTVQPPFWTPRRALVAAAFAFIVLAVLAWAVAVALAWLASNLVLVIGGLVVVAVIAAKAGPRVCQTIVTVTHRH
ncbi:hypothetical protein AB0M47_21130 [Hamadaea sp. NPDC051192]|uniref:hypothetical protein n=1 Tax=Hamadaea sp. NPDC051192 TaxID=3154940 RepID=UPI0034406395